MPYLTIQEYIPITASGGSWTLPSTATTEVYNLTGAATMISNVTIAPSGSYAVGLTYKFNYKAVLDITTNSTSITIFGQTLTAPQALNSQQIICIYNGTTWDVDIQSSFDDNNIVSTSNIQNGAITSGKIATGAIDTTSLADNSVTNDKLATMDPSSLKIGDASGDPADLILGADEIAIGDGTTIIAVNKSTLTTGTGLLEAIPLSISFESGEQNLYRYYTGYGCKLHAVSAIVTKTLSGTDVGNIGVSFNGVAVVPTSDEGVFQYPASTSANTVNAVHWSTHPTMLIPGTIDIIPSKTTPGGKVLVTILIERV